MANPLIVTVNRKEGLRKQEVGRRNQNPKVMTILVVKGKKQRGSEGGHGLSRGKMLKASMMLK